MLKGDAARDQRVLEVLRAEENEESIVEMVRQMDQKFDRLTTKFKASMTEFDKILAKATEIVAEQDSRESPTAAMSATAMATHMQCCCQIEAKMAGKGHDVHESEGPSQRRFLEESHG